MVSRKTLEESRRLFQQVGVVAALGARNCGLQEAEVPHLMDSSEIFDHSSIDLDDFG
jgi:hypothetical protein